MRIAAFVLGAGLTLALAGAAIAEPNLYERVEARLKADPALAEQLGKPTPEIQSLSWMIGRWRVTISRLQGPDLDGMGAISPVLGGTWLETRNSFSDRRDEVRYLTFNPVTKKWIGVYVDAGGYDITSAPLWNEDGLDLKSVSVGRHLQRRGEGLFYEIVSYPAAQGASYIAGTVGYTRIGGATVRAAPARVPTDENREVAWMVGTWDVTAVVSGGARAETRETGTSIVTLPFNGAWLEIHDTYPQGTQDIGFLTYDLNRKAWVAIALDSAGNAVVTKAKAWEGNRLVLSGKVVIVGEEVTLRQTVEKESDTAYSVTNSEQMADGSWVVLDRYEYRRRAN